MRNFIKGAIIGIALVVPGLSGSIFAVAVGLYDQLINSVNHFSHHPRANLRLLLVVGAGAIIGILLSTRAVLVAAERWPIASYAFFIGLVLGVAPFIRHKVKVKPFRWRYLSLTAGGFIAVYGLAQLGGAKPENLIALHRLTSLGDAGTMAFAGVFAVALMAISGISGSIMLMVIDQYGTVYNAVAGIMPALRALVSGQWAQFAAAMQTVALLGPFIIGAAVGFVAVAKLMGYLLTHFEPQVYYAVIGIVLAAVLILIETGLVPYWPANSWFGALTVVIGVGLGTAATMLLDKPA